MRCIVLCLGLAGCTTQASASELIDAAQRRAASEVDAAHRGTAIATDTPRRRVVQSTSIAGDAADAPHGPLNTTPQELFEDFTGPDGALLDKYRHGARFTGTIKTVGVQDDGSPVVWIEVDGEIVMSLEFATPPQQPLHAGGQLTVTCKLGEASGALMMVIDCTTS
jgi:hypothetical protein